MSIEIVTHCYAKEYPHFADCLKLQILSIRRYRPLCSVQLTVCCTKDDEITMNVIQKEEAWIKKIVLTLPELGRRAIGRHKAAIDTKADIVWFADADYCFVDNILDRLNALEWAEETVMVFPKEVMIHKNHAMGDETTDEAKKNNIVEGVINRDDFEPKRYYKAIGGAQIIKGDFAREHGHLPNTKWMKPLNTPFANTREDVAFRSFCLKHGNIVGVDLPGVYRIRHSTTPHN